eukprot:gene42824-52326_t
MTTPLEDALRKLREHATPFRFSSLPAERNDSLWSEIRSEYVTLSNETVAQLVAAIKLAIIPIPPTEPDTEVPTPAESQLPQPPEPPIPAPNAIVELSMDWAEYIPTRTHDEPDYYFKKLYKKFVEVNGPNVFQLVKTRSDIRIKENRQ